MCQPQIRYFVSSPYGNVSVDKDRWNLPLDGDALKTSYKTYFYAINNFIAKDDFNLLLILVSKKLAKEVKLKEVKEVVIRSEKHGFLYHPSSIDVILKEDKVKFCVNVAISAIGRKWLRQEFSVLKRLNKKFNLSYLPKAYFFAELNSISFLLEEWFDGYHEFHISKDKDEKKRLKVWDFSNGYKYLSNRQTFKVYKQASKILTSYYDLKDFSQIYPWHHGAGDFVVKEERGEIDVQLTTARRYEPVMVFLEENAVLNPVIGLWYFFLNLSLKMRLDKLDGTCEVVWADNICVRAMIEGFLEALKTKKGLKNYIGSMVEFISLLKSFKKEELKNSLISLMDLYKGKEDFPTIILNLDEHTEELFTNLQNLPL
jgi:hypothetical protein